MTAPMRVLLLNRYGGPEAAALATAPACQRSS